MVVQFAGSVRKSLRVEELEVCSGVEFDICNFSQLDDNMFSIWAALINNSVTLSTDTINTGI